MITISTCFFHNDYIIQLILPANIWQHCTFWCQHDFYWLLRKRDICIWIIWRGKGKDIFDFFLEKGETNKEKGKSSISKINCLNLEKGKVKEFFQMSNACYWAVRYIWMVSFLADLLFADVINIHVELIVSDMAEYWIE